MATTLADYAHPMVLWMTDTAELRHMEKPLGMGAFLYLLDLFKGINFLCYKNE